MDLKLSWKSGMDINAFAHPLKFDELIQQSFFCLCNELKFHILSKDGKMLGLSPGSKISISSKSGRIAPLCCQPSTYTYFC